MKTTPKASDAPTAARAFAAVWSNPNDMYNGGCIGCKGAPGREDGESRHEVRPPAIVGQVRQTTIGGIRKPCAPFRLSLSSFSSRFCRTVCWEAEMRTSPGLRSGRGVSGEPGRKRSSMKGDEDSKKSLNWWTIVSIRGCFIANAKEGLT